MSEPITEKKCSKCQELKAIEFFSKTSRAKDGQQSVCKDCVNKYYQENRGGRIEYQKKYRKVNKKKISENNKEYRKINKDKIAICQKEYSKEYREINKDKIIEKGKEYYHINKEKISETHKSYNQANKDKIDEYKKEYRSTAKFKISVKNAKHKRRAITKQGDVTTKQLLELQQNSKVCYWCECSLKNTLVHVDHYVPLAKGGEHTISNLVVSCQSCNQKKHSKDPLEFANKLGRLL